MNTSRKIHQFSIGQKRKKARQETIDFSIEVQLIVHYETIS